jgi:hypothetical protein
MGSDRRWTSAAGRAIGAALVLVLWSSCGASGSAGPAGVPRTETVVSLDANQLASLCDWVNASVGGYGSIDNCAGGGSRHANSTQQDCVDKGFDVCPSLTVGALEDCINAIGGDLCQTDTAPPCVSLYQCGSIDGGASSGG